jgi:signal transduction histidine kinase/HPt (histidine-containing phosphotransfer) domain-containing protein
MNDFMTGANVAHMVSVGVASLLLAWTIRLMRTSRKREIEIAEKNDRTTELESIARRLTFQHSETSKQAAELEIANLELAFQHSEKRKRAEELGIANIELAFQKIEKNKRVLELEEAKRDAQAASRAKSAFLSNMSHEVRTPMNAILGMTYLALKTNLDDKQRNYLEKINLGAKSLLQVINDILDFSKLDASKMGLATMPFDVADLISNLNAAVRATAAQKKITVLIDLSPSVPASLNGDIGRLGQVLINLASNAIKFSNAGDVELTISVSERQQGRVRLKFAMQDYGIGISPEQLTNLFDAFNQVDSSTTRKYGGIGLGLAISKSLVELMGGKLQVKSELGIGSIFSFEIWLPAPVLPAPAREKVAVVAKSDMQIEGIDGVAGLRFVGGNSQLYHSVLTLFADDYKDAPNTIRALLAANDKSEAESLVHTVKGVAAIVGATEFSAVAAKLEIALRQSLSVEQVTAALLDFEQKLLILLTNIQQALHQNLAAAMMPFAEMNE